MHAKIFDRISKNIEGYQYCWPHEVIPKLEQFLLDNIPENERYVRGPGSGWYLNIAGKNAAGFDIPFLKALTKQSESLQLGYFHVSYRVLDPALLYFDPNQDTALPNLTTCLKRAKIDTEVTHDALGDAMLIVQLLRKYYHNDNIPNDLDLKRKNDTTN